MPGTAAVPIIWAYPAPSLAPPIREWKSTLGGTWAIARAVKTHASTAPSRSFRGQSFTGTTYLSDVFLTPATAGENDAVASSVYSSILT